MISVTLDQVQKSYGNNPPTVSADIRIAAGEFFTLLGPSGCGKSTMLRMIAGFIQPTKGRILFDDSDVTRQPPNKRDTGMVFQNYALFPHMTVAQNVAYGLDVRRVAKSEKSQRITDALAQVGLAGYDSRRIDQLSGGQQQRVALARAVVISPSVLLLDEPLSNLDAKLREETRLQIRRVQQDAGLTAVYVTHDQAEAMAMSDRIAVLEAGRVHQLATPREVYHRPTTEFVAGFIGRSNVIPVTVREVRSGEVVVELPGGRRTSSPAPVEVAYGPGDAGMLSVRPELLRACPLEDASLVGLVGATEFTGASVTFEVTVGDLELTVTVPDQPGLPGTGDRIGLAWDTSRTWMVTK